MNHRVAIGESKDAANQNIRSVIDFISDKAASATVGKAPVGGSILKAAFKSASGAVEDQFLPVNNAAVAEDGRKPEQATAQELLQQAMGRTMYDSHNWTENGVDISGDTRTLRQKFPYVLNSDGTLKDWTELSFQQQTAMRDYFSSTSDFSPVYNHQLLAHRAES